jgi:hypothetical protein
MGMAHLKILDRFFKNTQMSNLIKIHPVGAKLFHVGRQPDKRDGAILIYIYISNKMQCYSLFDLETPLHVSGGTTAHRQELKQLYLQHLVFVTPLLLPATIVEELELV